MPFSKRLNLLYEFIFKEVPLSRNPATAKMPLEEFSFQGYFFVPAMHRLPVRFGYCESARRLASPTNWLILSSATRRAMVALMASTSSGLFFFTATAEPPSLSLKE